MKTLYLLAGISLGIATPLTSIAESEAFAAHAENSMTNENPPALLEQIDAPSVRKTPISRSVPAQYEPICRKEARLGTRIVKLVCRSRAEIAAESEAAQKRLRKQAARSDSGAKGRG